MYDVYYAEGNMLCDFDDSLLDGLVSLQPFNTGTEFVYDEYRLEGARQTSIHAPSSGVILRVI